MAHLKSLFMKTVQAVDEEKKMEVVDAALTMLAQQGIEELHDLAFMSRFPDMVEAMVIDAKLEDEIIDDVKALIGAAMQTVTGCDHAWASKEHRKLMLSQGSASGTFGNAAQKACGAVQASSQLAPPPQDTASSNLGRSGARGDTVNAGVPRSRKRKQLDSAVSTLAMGADVGDGVSQRAPALAESLLEKDVRLMDSTLDSAWLFFKTEMKNSPRGKELFADDRVPSDEEIAVVRDMLRDGSKSHKAVAQRIRGARRYLTETRRRDWCPWSLTGLQQAAWLRMQQSRGPSCPAHAATILRWLASVADFRTHSVRLAFRIKIGADALVQERPTKATCPSLADVRGLVEQITDAPTIQLRVFAGICVLAIENSCGFREANRVRNLSLTDEAIVGESRAKSHNEWLPWACCRIGLAGIDWASRWMEQLVLAGLPAADFVTNAATRDGKAWLNRVADHPDANAMLQLLLTLPPHNMDAGEACKRDFHGLKRLYPTLGIQLKAVGTISDERGIERLGHWAKGSAMPEAYNNELCVAELHTRSVVSEAIRGGWQPAAFGCIPRAPKARAASSSGSANLAYPLAVRRKSGKVHVLCEPPTTVCRMWECGSPDDETDVIFMQIGDVPADSSWCKTCSRAYMK